MKKLNDWTLLWLISGCVALGFVVGAAWAHYLQPPVALYTPVTPATSAPATVYQEQP